jgi:hypothetical protein
MRQVLEGLPDSTKAIRSKTALLMRVKASQLPFLSLVPHERAPKRFSIWLAGLTERPYGFETVDWL